MKVATRTSSPKTGPDVVRAVRRRRSKRLSALVAGTVIAAAATIGVLGGDGAPAPSPTTISAEQGSTPVIPFPSVPPASGGGNSSADG